MQLLYADYSTALRTYCLWAHEVLCWGHTFLQANNCMWLRLTSSDEDAPMRYIVSHQTQWQSQWKTPRGREQCHMNGYTLGHLRGQGKWPTGAPIWLPLEFCSFVKRLFYRKRLIINQAIAVLRRPVGLLGQFVTVWRNRTGHTHKHTQLL